MPDIEQSIGERIAADFNLNHIHCGWRRIAAAIDAARAEAWEEANDEHERLLAHAREVRGSRDVHSAYEVLDWQRQQLAAKDAEAAAMREALQNEVDTQHLDDTGCYRHYENDPAKAALSTTAGADLLARLRAAEEALTHWKTESGFETPEEMIQAVHQRFEKELPTSLSKALWRVTEKEVVDLKQQLRVAEEKAAALESRPRILKAALVKLWKHTPKIENGYCAVCRRGRRSYDHHGNVSDVPCTDADCLSHVVEDALAAIQAACAKEPS